MKSLNNITNLKYKTGQPINVGDKCYYMSKQSRYTILQIKSDSVIMIGADDIEIDYPFPEELSYEESA